MLSRAGPQGSPPGQRAVRLPAAGSSYKGSPSLPLPPLPVSPFICLPKHPSACLPTHPSTLHSVCPYTYPPTHPPALLFFYPSTYPLSATCPSFFHPPAHPSFHPSVPLMSGRPPVRSRTVLNPGQRAVSCLERHAVQHEDGQLCSKAVHPAGLWGSLSSWSGGSRLAAQVYLPAGSRAVTWAGLGA